MAQEQGNSGVGVVDVDRDVLRREITKEYAEVATNPDKGFHFHTGRHLAGLLEYEESWLEHVSPGALESFAGTGNPFSMGVLKPGENVVDIGSGAGIDSQIAGRMVGPEGQVTGVDMTPAMLEKARSAATDAGLTNVQFMEGHSESLPVPDGSTDVVISNGVVNLSPDKNAVFAEMFRVLRPGGRLQIGDILVNIPVPEAAKLDVDLWTG